MEPERLFYEYRKAKILYLRKFKKPFPFDLINRDVELTEERLEAAVKEASECIKTGQEYDVRKLKMKKFTTEELEEAMEMYEAAFNEGFPYFQTPRTPESIVNIINKAFSTGKAYDPNPPDDNGQSYYY